MDSVQDWIDEIDAAKKREKHFMEAGKEILEIYEDGEKKTPFNILYSNTETLLPAIHSHPPRPVIKRRFNDADPVGKAAADAGQRMLEYLMDTDHDKYETFNEGLESAVLDALLPGRGVTSIKYNSKIDEEEYSVDDEMICVDSKPWDRVYFGYAKKWSQVPWVAYENYLDRKEAKKQFGEEAISGLKFTTDNDEDEEDEKNKGKSETICVYQIWDKADKKVKYITPQDKDNFLKEDDDPLELTGFFNCPKPLTFIRKSSNLTPTALYTLYEKQAKELNRIQLRLDNIIEAIKVRGCYDGQLGDELEKIFDENDNALIPTDKSATLVDKGGFDKSIWFLPIEKLITVARELYTARESCKRVIYEITGISDIVRGQSAASETLGAQKIKETWGTMRLKRLQKEAQRYAVDLIKIMLEIAIKQFDPKMWAAITNLSFPTMEEKQKAQQMMQQLQGAQPPPQLTEVLEKPTWEDILKLLGDDKLRMYRIDIETNSTLDVEATEDKQLIAEFMNSIAQFMNGINPLIDKGYMDFEIAKSMILEIVRRYRFGRDVEDQIAAMHPPKDNTAQAKQQMEAQGKKLQEQGKQLQDQGKQLTAEKQKLEQEKAKFEQEKQSATENLNKQANKLELDTMKFDFKQKLADVISKATDKVASAEHKAEKVATKAELEKATKDTERNVQSMIDKHEARMTKNAQ